MTNQHDQNLQENSGESKAARDWNDSRVARLKAAWAKGWTASQIAQDLGGISRNAVIGKVRRLGLAFRITPGDTTAYRNVTSSPRNRRSDPRPRVLKRAAPKPPPRIRDMNPAQPSLIRDAKLDVPRVAFADLEPHHCRWPIGDPTQGFCGCPKHPGTPYCQAHGERAYGVRVDMIPGAVAGTIKHDNATHAAVTEFLEAVA